MPFGAELAERGVRFAVWAPGAAEARLHLDGRDLPMERGADGFFVRIDDSARAGSRYAFSFDGRDLLVPDPASRFNPEDVHAPSEVVDPAAFDWADERWRGRPWREAVIYELHVGTFTPEGTYAAARARLDYLAELGVTAIELMPLADTPGTRNWGYDGVLPFAPEHGFGRPEELKRFVQAAHARGLMLLLDVVYNHFGPEGNYLSLYAPQFFTDRHHTPWGSGLNFDDSTRARSVRQFFIHNALYWLEEYHFDGLRLDAVHAIADDSDPTLPRRSRGAGRAAARPRSRRCISCSRTTTTRRAILRRARDGEPRAYTAQWNDDFHHALHVLIAQTRPAITGLRPPGARTYCARCSRGSRIKASARATATARRGEPSAHLPPDAFVNFLQNHDQIGNRPDGKRLWMLIPPERMLAAELLLALLPTPIMLFMGDEFRRAEPVSILLRLSAASSAPRSRKGAGARPRHCSPTGFPVASAVADRARDTARRRARLERGDARAARGRARAHASCFRHSPLGALSLACRLAPERGALLGERALEGSWLSQTAHGSRRRESGPLRVARVAGRRASRSRDRRAALGRAASPLAGVLDAGARMSVSAVPRATYRIQLNQRIRFSGRRRARSVPRAARREPLLLLAVSENTSRQRRTATTSRIIRAEPGARRARGLRRALWPARGRTTWGRLLDIVPNHIGIMGATAAGGSACSRTGKRRATRTTSTSIGDR